MLPPFFKFVLFNRTSNEFKEGDVILKLRPYAANGYGELMILKNESSFGLNSLCDISGLISNNESKYIGIHGCIEVNCEKVDYIFGDVTLWFCSSQEDNVIDNVTAHKNLVTFKCKPNVVNKVPVKI